MHERKTDIAFVSEVWEKQEKKKHQKKIEELFHLEGVKYVSNPRRNGKRGGGVALAVNLEKFSVSKLNIYSPKNVEVVWGLLSPKVYNKKLNTIIACCFYSPPNLGANTDLVNHLTLTLNNLLNIHKNAGVILAEDRNHIEISTLLSIEPSLHQIVNKPTLGSKVLDVVLTNLYGLFKEPEILPPLTPDFEGKGVASDHAGVLILPSANGNRTRLKKTKYIRPMPDSSINYFKEKLDNVDFKFLFKDMNTDSMTQSFEKITSDLLCQTFPEKRIVIYHEDKPWFTEELRVLKRQRLREYTKHGKSKKYLELEKKFSLKVKEAVNKYMNKIKLEVTEGKRGSAYPIIKNLAKHPEDNTQSQFALPSHIERNLTPIQSAEILADHFSKISCEYEPLSISNLPVAVQTHLNTRDAHNAPYLSVNAVYSRIVKAKKPHGFVPGDIPRKLVRQCAKEIAKPAQIIFNSITKSASYPSKWKTEHQIPIPKIPHPTTEDELHNIAKTPFLSKVNESFIAQWTLAIIKPYLDPNQCGIKGSSINHYLLKLLHFIHQTLDSRKPSAVLVASTGPSLGLGRVGRGLGPPTKGGHPQLS